MLASRNNDLNTLSLLLHYGADPNVTEDLEGFNAMFIRIMTLGEQGDKIKELNVEDQNSVHIVNLLIEKGADVDAVLKNEVSVLKISLCDVNIKRWNNQNWYFKKKKVYIHTCLANKNLTDDVSIDNLQNDEFTCPSINNYFIIIIWYF